jgi:hypothetical protein
VVSPCLQWYILFPFSSNVNKHISAVIFLFGKPVRWQ